MCTLSIGCFQAYHLPPGKKPAACMVICPGSGGLFDSQGVVHLKYKSLAFFEERVKYHYPLFSKSESKSHIFKMVISFFFFCKTPK